MDYSYLTPEQIEQMAQFAQTQDPQDQIDALMGLQQMANRMHSNGIPLRENGRVVGPTSGWEVAGNAAKDMAGAYMNKNLSDKYKGILDQNSASRGNYAKAVIDALRRKKEEEEGLPMTGSEFNMYGGGY